jgi:hypothetical protein
LSSFSLDSSKICLMISSHWWHLDKTHQRPKNFEQILILTDLGRQ